MSDKDFPASLYQSFVNKRVVRVEDAPDSDEGLRLTFEDGTVLDFGFSGCEGTILELDKDGNSV